MSKQLDILRLGVMLLALGLASCQKASIPQIGKHCKVQLRRDYLGLTSSNGVPIVTDSFNGTDVSVRGRLISADERWVVVRPREAKSKDDDIWDIWIPREAILIIYATPTDLTPPPSPRA